MKFFERNPVAWIPVLLILLIVGLTAWKAQRDFASFGLSVVPTSRLEAIEERNQELNSRVEQLEKRLNLVIWLTRECPEIRRTMDEHGAYQTDE
jgi:hypothetical protein